MFSTNSSKIAFVCFYLLLSSSNLANNPNEASVPSTRLQTASVVLSEIMYDPLGSEYYDEFVEIVNLSVTDSVDLNGWQIGDGEGFDHIVAVDAGLKLAPGQFGLILDSGYLDNSTSYNALIPPSALLLTIDGATFGKNGWSNSVAKNVELLNVAGDIIDQYTYTLGNQPGYSDEKIHLSDENTTDNWADCLQLFGTPGFRNSVSPQDYDLSLTLIGSPPEPLQIGSTYTLSFKIKNEGTVAAENYHLVGYQITQQFELDSALFYSHDFSTTIHSQEELDWQLQFTVTNAGLIEFHFYLLWQEEKKPSDNQISFFSEIPFQTGIIVVNEIMYYPDVSQSEWLEIFNTSPNAIDMQGWRIATTEEINQAKLIAKENLIFDANGYLVLTSDSLWCMTLTGVGVLVRDLPRLSDNGGELYLFDPTGHLIDTAVFRPEWGRQRGFSLERIWSERAGTDSSNWRLSDKQLGTPGRFNSRSPLQTDFGLLDLRVSPNPVPYEMAATLQFTVRNLGRTTVQQAQLTLFVDTNNDSLPQIGEILLPLQMIDFQFTAEADSTIQWALPILPSGILNLAVRVDVANDQNPINDFQQIELKIGYPPLSLVINEILFLPAAGQPEWLELFNRSVQAINLRDWFICEYDFYTRYQIAVQDCWLPAAGFCVLTADSALQVPPSAVLVVLSRLPTLNNDIDQIQLCDCVTEVIDAVSYSSSWGGETGISLERINPNLASQDSSNWSNCADITGMTPGRVNSIFTEVIPSDASLSVSPNPFSPDGDGFEDVAIIQYHLPMTTATVSLQVYDSMGRLVCELLNAAHSGSQREIIWNGKKNNGESLRLGIYILYLEALNAQHGVIKRLKIPVVLAGRL